MSETEALMARITELEAERGRLLRMERAAKALASQIDRRADSVYGLSAEFLHNNPEYRAFRRALLREKS